MAIVLAVALACGALLKIYVIDPNLEASDDPGYNPPGLLSLPGKDVDAGLVLGHSRADVLKLLGTPVESTPTSDTFKPGPGLTVRYADDVASTVIIEWPDIARHERYARRWLHLAGDGPLSAGDLPLRILKFVGHDERFGIEIATPVQTAVAEHAAHVSHAVHVAHLEYEAPAVPLPSVDALLHAFPELSEGVRRACHPVNPAETVLGCSGFDGAVSYEVAGESQAKVLTVLDPSTAKTEDECRALLQRNRPELTPGATSNRGEGRKVVHFSSPQADAQYVWVAVGGFRKTPSCSVMLCDKAQAGARNSCTR